MRVGISLVAAASSRNSNGNDSSNVDNNQLWMNWVHVQVVTLRQLVMRTMTYTLETVTIM